MAVNAFIQYSVVEGESSQKGYEKWSEIQSWSFGSDAETSWTRGGGASVGKANPGAISVAKYFDKSSVEVMKRNWMGTVIPKVYIHMLKTTGKGTPEVYLTVELNNVYITMVSQSGGEEGNVNENVSMVYQIIKFNYRPQDTATGSLLAAIPNSWDVKANVVT